MILFEVIEFVVCFCVFEIKNDINEIICIECNGKKYF